MKTKPAAPQKKPSWLRRIATMIGLALAPLVLVLVVFVVWVWIGVAQGSAYPTGTQHGFDVSEPVSIARDDRGIPHIRAKNLRDLYFAEGYAQGTDRLFQLDLYRRVVAGTLSEALGSVTESTDEDARTVDVKAIADAQYATMPAEGRTNLQAFADGVNAAMTTRPLPPEFRILAYQPKPWTPQDSLIVSFSTVLALTDSWWDVEMRDGVLKELGPKGVDAFFPMSDPLYDAPPVPDHAPIAKLPDLTIPYPDASPLYVAQDSPREGLGSNNFAAGAQQTTTHRALLASDPHLELHMPGVWWMCELEAPGFHVAGASLAGVPGVVLGHGEHLAWGATNGTVATVQVYREKFRDATSDEYLANGKWLHAEHRHETIPVRFGKSVERDYLRTRHGFVFDDQGAVKYAAAWTNDAVRISSFGSFDALARANSVPEAIALLAHYTGPPQNFALADDKGNAGFTLAGAIPIDSYWGMHVHDGATDPGKPPKYVPGAQLPHVDGSRNAVIWTANARTYGKGYPYRLSAAFTPPYRAARIEQLLKKRPLAPDDFSAIQADVLSLPERDLAKAAVAALENGNAQNDPDLGPALTALQGFDGHMTSDSRGAVYVVALRRACVERIVRLHISRDLGFRYAGSQGQEAFSTFLRALREKPKGWVPNDDYDAFLRDAMREGIAGMASRHETGLWADAGARIAQHPLASFGWKAWNGTRFPGLGDAYTPHVQAPANAQSYRAVWDVGNWDAGGMVIPQGESGEPGSAHYRDSADIWLAGSLVPLPFSNAAVQAATKESLFIER